MKERFEGPGRSALVDAIRRHELVAGDHAIADAVISSGHLVEFQKDEVVFTEGAEDSDIYFLIAGSVGIVIKGNDVASRRAGEPVGEMAAIEPQKRSATVVARETVVAIKLSAAAFIEIGKTNPQVWLPLARLLARRLLERNKLIGVPNEQPRLFVISSSEALPAARALQDALYRDVRVQVWTDGVFFAGGYNLEALEAAVDSSDFAVAIAQPDDILETRGRREATLRDNVLFELGLFMGRLKRHRAILIHPEVAELKLPSDLRGLTLLSYQVGPEGDLPVNIAPVANALRALVKTHGVRTQSG